MSRSRSTTGARAGWPWATPTSSTRSCGRSSTTRSSTAPGGRSTVEIAVAGGRLRLTIADHGPGVADEDRGRLFGRFARGSAQNAEDGSGLGLYVARELCRAMGGDLVLEPPAAGRGAAFSVWLKAEVPVEG